MRTYGLRIEALDTLFFRDGRPFTAASRAGSGLPTPQTLAGALRTWLLRSLDCDFDALGRAQRDEVPFSEALADQNRELFAVSECRFKGPWPARLLQHGAEPLVPVPLALRKLKQGKTLMRLMPLTRELPGWEPPVEGMLPLWLNERAQVEVVNGWLTLQALALFLQGGVPHATVPDNELFGYESRTGIGVDPDKQSAGEGLIYAVNLLRMQSAVGFYAEITMPQALEKQVPVTPIVIPFGGEGRRVVVHFQEPVAWPQAPQLRQGQFRTRILLSPALVEDSECLVRWKVKAAALGPWQAVSGWDLALRGPKPLRWAMPAGSTLYFDSRENAPENLCPGETGQLGWGTYLEGVSDHV